MDSVLPRGSGAELTRRPSRRVPAGALVYAMGEPARSLFLVKSGLVRIGLVAESGEELTLRLSRPGEIFGELCLCIGERGEQAVALEASDLVEMALADVLAQLRQDAPLLLELLDDFSRRLAEAYDRIGSARFDRTRRRLLRKLLELGEDLGKPAGADLVLPRSIGQLELARMVGARREVVSGLLNRFREQALVRYSRGGPIRIDLGALRATLAGAPAGRPHRHREDALAR